MAYMSQEKKAKLAPGIKAILKEYGLKGSISVDHHTSLVLTIKNGKIDFFGNGEGGERSVNTYHIESHYTGKALEALLKLKEAMMVGNHNNSDAMVDYFDVGWYIDINIGKWDKPYILTK